MQKHILIFFLICFVFLACDEKPDTCKEQSARLMQIGFYRSSPFHDSTLASIKADLNAYSFSKTGSRVQNITLPLAESSDSSIYTLTINGNKTTTFKIFYKRNLVFENYKCGFRYDFEVDSIVTIPQICDSIKIKFQTVTDVNQENCRFYFNRDPSKYE